MKVIDCVQGSPEWHQARAGLPTSSRFDMLITTACQPSKQRQKYLYKLAGEKISKLPEDTYQSEAMKRGVELEAEARRVYETMTGNTVTEVGLCLSDCERYGASPDGTIGDEGLLEIKCPMISTHVRYLLEGQLPTEYYQQTQGQLLVTRRRWVDFMSYSPGIKPLIIRVTADSRFQEALVSELRLFCRELESVIQRIS